MARVLNKGDFQKLAKYVKGLLEDAEYIGAGVLHAVCLDFLQYSLSSGFSFDSSELVRSHYMKIVNECLTVRNFINMKISSDTTHKEPALARGFSCEIEDGRMIIRDTMDTTRENPTASL